MFYSGAMFPAHYRGGAFATSHGSGIARRSRWLDTPCCSSRSRMETHPGTFEVFADGFKGKDPITSPREAAARPNGTARGA